jgi:steroid 5-alpha reductase family enzyme
MTYLISIIPDLLFYLILSVGFNLLLFIPAFIFKTDKLTDISYSISFIFLSLTALIVEGEGYFTEFIVFLMILIWAIRLGGYLLYRIHKMKKDNRFDKMRDSFIKFGAFWLLQGITVWVVMIPALLFFISNNLPAQNEVKIALIGIGFLTWAFGLIVETTADIQKFKYIEKAKVENKPRHWVDTGLWNYSRHPNYLGEIIVWIGLYVLVITRITFAASLVALVGPLFIFIIIRFMSGVPILERKDKERYGKDPEYIKYVEETGLIIPNL